MKTTKQNLFTFLTGLNDQRVKDGKPFMGPALTIVGGKTVPLPINLEAGVRIPLHLFDQAQSTPGYPMVDTMLDQFNGCGRVTAQAIGAEDGGNGRVTAQAIGAEDGGNGRVTAQAIGAEDGVSKPHQIKRGS